LADQFGATVRLITPQDEIAPHEKYANFSYIQVDAKPKEILLGHFQDEEVCTLFFFHELGHAMLEDLLDDPTSTFSEYWCTLYEEEKEAWRLGLDLAKRHQICFSPDTLVWVDYALGTYQEADNSDFHLDRAVR
jgi:hypothetical protein